MALTSVVALGVFACGGDPSADCSTYQLDSARWKQERKRLDFDRLTSSERFLRQTARDLVRCHALVGMTERQARARLGKPHAEADFNPRPHRDLTWTVGFSPARGSNVEDRLHVEVDFGRVVYASAPARERGGADTANELTDGGLVGGGPRPEN